MADRSFRIVPDEDTTKVVDPWVNSKPNAKLQTGGDWYSIHLSASLGGKSVHGVNTAPSMEVLGKSPNTQDGHPESGRIRWDPKVFIDSKLGHRVSDQFYTHHHYRGGDTSTGAVLAFSPGAWEPSIRARARSTSMLAAGIAAHGCTKAEALRTVSIISGEEIDAEAVEATILPASHLKREMTIVAKPNHRLFSQGTIQQGITWEDQNLTLKSKMPHIAYDWGRITAIARYIAEANIQVCPKFRAEAADRGVPYHIMRNAWAAVAAEDYELRPELFSDVPALKTDALGIPSLKGAYVNHESEIMTSLTKFLNSDIVSLAADAYKGFIQMYKHVQRQAAKRKRPQRAHINDIAEEYELPEGMHAEEIRHFLKNSQSAWEILVSAIATRRRHDAQFEAQVIEFSTATPDEKPYLIDQMTKAIFGRASWALAKAELQRLVSNIEDPIERNGSLELLRVQLGQLKSKLFGLHQHLDSPVMFTPEIYATLRPHAQDAIAASSKAKPLENMTPHDIYCRQAMELEQNFAHLDEEGQEIMNQLRSDVAATYKDAYLDMIKRQKPDDNQKALNYFFTYKALKTLGVRTASLKTSGFVDASNPKDSYIYKTCKKLAQKYNYPKPQLRFINYVDALSIAQCIQRSSGMPYLLDEAVQYATNVMEKAIGLLLHGLVFEPPSDLITMDYEGHSDLEDEGHIMMANFEQEDRLASLYRRMSQFCSEPTNDEFNVLLHSYPNSQLAEEHAKAHGYDSFREAYNERGEAVVYAEENPYTIEARMEIAKKQAAPPEKYPGADLGYKPML